MITRSMIAAAFLGLTAWCFSTAVERADAQNSDAPDGKGPAASQAAGGGQNAPGEPGAIRPGPGRGPGGFGPGRGPGRGGRAFGQPSPENLARTFDATTLAKDDQEKKILAVLAEMDNERQGMMNVPAEDGRLLRLLTETTGAKNVIEIGTSSGYSGIWFSLALRGTGGKLTTYEIDAGRAALARKNFKRAGVGQYITLVEGDAHEEITKLTESIDLIFLDADKEGYLDYLDKLMPLVRPGGLIVAHNMNTRQADVKFVEAVTTNPKLETLFLHMDAAGVAVSMKKR